MASDLANTLDTFSRSALSMDLRMDEDERGYHIHAQMPGMNRDDFDISFEEGRLLRIAAKHKEDKKTDTEGFHSEESSCSRTTRTVRLPENADPEDISAEYRDGTLFVNVAKKAGPALTDRPLEGSAQEEMLASSS